MKKTLILVLSLSLAGVLGFSQQTRGITESPEMQILGTDIVVQGHTASDGTKKGVDVYIRKKSAIKSVMLVETTKDPEGKADNYAYRADSWNEVNGDEVRYLNGRELNSEYSKYSLISSTVVKHPALGDCFHIYVPETIYYGYPWSRNGSVKIGKGTFINIRTFEKPYGDYTGRFMDNAFMFDFGKKPEKPKPPVVPPVEEKIVEPEPEPEPEEIILTDDYNSLAAEKFAEIAKDGAGLLYYSNKEKLTDDLLSAVDRITPHDKVDVVFAIDTTGSMKDDMDKLRNEWVPRLLEQVKQFEDLRLGLLLYRDFNDTYNYKGLPVKFFDFTRNTSQFTKNLGSVLIHGNEGGDIPEAVYEALYGGLSLYDWRQDAARKIILIGDAEPHPKPRGPKKISQEMVMTMAKEKKVVLDCIIVPDEKAKK
ncbi:MAG: VWA domain-containing protein [Treponema sp.]|nr:VWA domain-containing protein [Candidatus Treponema equi]